MFCRSAGYVAPPLERLARPRGVLAVRFGERRALATLFNNLQPIGVGAGDKSVPAVLLGWALVWLVVLAGSTSIVGAHTKCECGVLGKRFFGTL